MPPADQPYIVWTGSTDYAGYTSSNSPPNLELDCRAAVGELSDTNDAHETLVCTQSGDLTIFSTGNSLAAPVAAGLAATLWDMLPSGPTDAKRRDKVIDVIQRTCTKVFEDPDNEGARVDRLDLQPQRAGDALVARDRRASTLVAPEVRQRERSRSCHHRPRTRRSSKGVQEVDLAPRGRTPRTRCIV